MNAGGIFYLSVDGALFQSAHSQHLTVCTYFSGVASAYHEDVDNIRMMACNEALDALHKLSLPLMYRIIKI
jgi:hypothetical protein